MASILAVDDEPANLDLLEAILSPLGHTIRTASGAIPALHAVVDEVLVLATTPLGPRASEAVRRGACACIVKGLPPRMGAGGDPPGPEARRAGADGDAATGRGRPPLGGPAEAGPHSGAAASLAKGGHSC